MSAKSILFFLLIILCFVAHVTGHSHTHCRSTNIGFGPDVDTNIIKSPGFPNHYCNNTRNVWDIEPKGEYAVRLTNEFFETEENHDFVEIHQTFWWNSQLKSVKQHALSGSVQQQPRHFSSAVGGGLRIIFITDATINDFNGFRMSFARFHVDTSRYGGKSIAIHSTCPFPYHDAPPPGTPLKLPIVDTTHKMDKDACVIQVNATDAIKLRVNQIADKFTVKIYETDSFRNNRMFEIFHRINTYTTEKVPYEMSSRTNSLTFLIIYSAEAGTEDYDIEVESTTSVCSCRDIIAEVNSSTSYVMTSPGFPFDYCDELRCNSTIHAVYDEGVEQTSPKQGKIVVQMTVNSFNVETDVDYLQLGGPQPLVNLTNAAHGIKTFTFDGPIAQTRFFTDHSIVDQGFNVSFKSYVKPHDCLCPGNPAILTALEAEQNFTFYEHCKYEDCFWRIMSPPDDSTVYRVVIKINYKLVHENEFIEISNGDHQERNIATVNLDSEDMLDTADTAERFVEFDVGNPFIQIWYHRQGDNRVGDRIINFDYSWRKMCQCGEVYIDASAEDWTVLTSPDYPTPYCNSLTCTWHILAPEHHRVVVNLTDFVTEIDQDFLGIFNGNDTNGTHIELLSGIEQMESLVESDGPMLSIVFKSDDSVSFRGFSLKFKAQPTEDYTAPASGFPLILLTIAVVFIIFIFATGIYLFRTDNIPEVGNNTLIWFTNRSRVPRTDSRTQIINPTYRSMPE